MKGTFITFMTYFVQVPTQYNYYNNFSTIKPSEKLSYSILLDVSNINL